MASIWTVLVATSLLWIFVTAQDCVLTDDQCTCVEKEAGKCVKSTAIEGVCTVTNCDSSWMCDCTVGSSVSDTDIGTDVRCTSQDVVVATAEESICEFAGADCIQACLWSVKIEGTSFACILAIPIEVSVAEWYGYTPEQSQTTVTEGLRPDYANIRITNTTFDNSFYFCNIYSDGQQPDDGTGLSRSSTATLQARYPLGWQVQDDPPRNIPTTDTYSTNETTTLTSSHRFKSNKSDGFCVGPMDYRQGNVIIDYSGLVNVQGLHFQAWDAETNSIVTLDTFELEEGKDTIGPVLLRPNCFSDCLASIGEL